VDAGVDEGSEIPLHYDPMISKVVAWGRTREEAIRRMKRALDEYRIAGVQTTIPFCRFVLDHPAFRDGTFSTHFIDDFFSPEDLVGDVQDRNLASAVATALVSRQNGASAESGGVESDGWSDWAVRRRRNGRSR
jgi:propionyl-CoA carboxylase alpha chain